MGVADSVHPFAPDGRDRHLHPAPAAGGRRSSRPSRPEGRRPRIRGREAFLSQNLKFVFIASMVVLGEGVVWYSGQFWALYFLQQIRKPDVLSPAIITGVALLIATPTLILFGWLSDKIGRKPIILAGFALAAPAPPCRCDTAPTPSVADTAGKYCRRRNAAIGPYTMPRTKPMHRDDQTASVVRCDLRPCRAAV